MDNNYYNNMNENNTNQNNTNQSNTTGAPTGSAYGTNSGSAYGTNPSQGNGYGTAYNAYNPYQQPTGGPAPRKPRRRSGFGATIGKCAAVALVFGLVAGGVFTGVSYVGTKALGVSGQNVSSSKSSSSAKVSQTSTGNAADLSDVSGIAKRQCRALWQLQIPERYPIRHSGGHSSSRVRVQGPVLLSNRTANIFTLRQTITLLQMPIH